MENRVITLSILEDLIHNPVLTAAPPPPHSSDPRRGGGARADNTLTCSSDSDDSSHAERSTPKEDADVEVAAHGSSETSLTDDSDSDDESSVFVNVTLPASEEGLFGGESLLRREARYEAVLRLPLLCPKLGTRWTHAEVVPYLLRCVEEEDARLSWCVGVTLLGLALPRCTTVSVDSYLSLEKLQPVVVALCVSREERIRALMTQIVIPHLCWGVGLQTEGGWWLPWDVLYMPTHVLHHDYVRSGVRATNAPSQSRLRSSHSPHGSHVSYNEDEDDPSTTDDEDDALYTSHTSVLRSCRSQTMRVNNDDDDGENAAGHGGSGGRYGVTRECQSGGRRRAGAAEEDDSMLPGMEDVSIEASAQLPSADEEEDDEYENCAEDAGSDARVTAALRCPDKATGAAAIRRNSPAPWWLMSACSHPTFQEKQHKAEQNRTDPPTTRNNTQNRHCKHTSHHSHARGNHDSRRDVAVAHEYRLLMCWLNESQSLAWGSRQAQSARAALPSAVIPRCMRLPRDKLYACMSHKASSLLTHVPLSLYGASYARYRGHTWWDTQVQSRMLLHDIDTWLTRMRVRVRSMSAVGKKTKKSEPRSVSRTSAGVVNKVDEEEEDTEKRRWSVLSLQNYMDLVPDDDSSNSNNHDIGHNRSAQASVEGAMMCESSAPQAASNSSVLTLTQRWAFVLGLIETLLTHSSVGATAVGVELIGVLTEAMQCVRHGCALPGTNTGRHHTITPVTIPSTHTNEQNTHDNNPTCYSTQCTSDENVCGSDCGGSCCMSSMRRLLRTTRACEPSPQTAQELALFHHRTARWHVGLLIAAAAMSPSQRARVRRALTPVGADKERADSSNPALTTITPGVEAVCNVVMDATLYRCQRRLHRMLHRHGILRQSCDDGLVHTHRSRARTRALHQDMYNAAHMGNRADTHANARAMAEASISCTTEDIKNNSDDDGNSDNDTNTINTVNHPIPNTSTNSYSNSNKEVLSCTCHTAHSRWQWGSGPIHLRIAQHSTWDLCRRPFATPLSSASGAALDAPHLRGAALSMPGLLTASVLRSLPRLLMHTASPLHSHSSTHAHNYINTHLASWWPTAMSAVTLLQSVLTRKGGAGCNETDEQAGVVILESALTAFGPLCANVAQSVLADIHVRGACNEETTSALVYASHAHETSPCDIMLHGGECIFAEWVAAVRVAMDALGTALTQVMTQVVAHAAWKLRWLALMWLPALLTSYAHTLVCVTESATVGFAATPMRRSSLCAALASCAERVMNAVARAASVRVTRPCRDGKDRVLLHGNGRHVWCCPFPSVHSLETHKDVERRTIDYDKVEEGRSCSGASLWSCVTESAEPEVRAVSLCTLAQLTTILHRLHVRLVRNGSGGGELSWHPVLSALRRRVLSACYTQVRLGQVITTSSPSSLLSSASSESCASSGRERAAQTESSLSKGVINMSSETLHTHVNEPHELDSVAPLLIQSTIEIHNNNNNNDDDHNDNQRSVSTSSSRTSTSNSSSSSSSSSDTSTNSSEETEGLAAGHRVRHPSDPARDGASEEEKEDADDALRATTAVALLCLLRAPWHPHRRAAMTLLHRLTADVSPTVQLAALSALTQVPLGIPNSSSSTHTRRYEKQAKHKEQQQQQQQHVKRKQTSSIRCGSWLRRGLRRLTRHAQWRVRATAAHLLCALLARQVAPAWRRRDSETWSSSLQHSQSSPVTPVETNKAKKVNHNDKAGRIRQALCRDAERHLLPHLVNVLLDRVEAVRGAAAQATGRLCSAMDGRGAVSAETNFANTVIWPWLQHRVAHRSDSSSYHTRVALLRLATRTLHLPMETVVLPLLRQLAGDGVANVRLGVAAVVTELLHRRRRCARRAGRIEQRMVERGRNMAWGSGGYVRGSVFSDEQVNGEVLSLLRRLVEDESPSVREVAMAGLALCF